MTRRRRSFAAALVALSLAFSQFAVSAHACELPSMAGPDSTVSHPECCDGAALEKDAGTNVCERHCHYGDVSFHSSPLLPMAMPSPGAILRVELSLDPVGAAPAGIWRRPPAAATPPPAILFGVLRI